jgi:hypothetical protein
MSACRIVFRAEDHYELRFRSLVDAAETLAFPCDRSGRVDMDGLNERARATYLFARAVVGALFSRPDVHCRVGAQS